MDIDGGLVTSNMVELKAVETNKVIDAEPYLRYMEDRVFSGMGVPGILFGRGGTANRSTGDNMSGEMSDRVKAFQRIIEILFNFQIMKEILLEGGYDPVLNPEHIVQFRFKHCDVDTQIKQEVHAIYKYEHNSITEDEMRALLGVDPITDRAKMFQTLITQANANATASNNTQSSNSKSDNKSQGTKSTNNKEKPTNQHKTKTSPKKETNNVEVIFKDMKNTILNNLKTKNFEEVNKAIVNANTDIANIIDNNNIKAQFFNLVQTINDLSNEEDFSIFLDIVSTLIDIVENVVINTID